jgi:hypothetical protein
MKLDQPEPQFFANGLTQLQSFNSSSVVDKKKEKEKR